MKKFIFGGFALLVLSSFSAPNEKLVKEVFQSQNCCTVNVRFEGQLVERFTSCGRAAPCADAASQTCSFIESRGGTCPGLNRPAVEEIAPF